MQLCQDWMQNRLQDRIAEIEGSISSMKRQQTFFSQLCDSLEGESTAQGRTCNICYEEATKLAVTECGYSAMNQCSTPTYIALCPSAADTDLVSAYAAHIDLASVHVSRALFYFCENCRDLCVLQSTKSST